jgi:protein-tyrosine phosphatase
MPSSPELITPPLIVDARHFPWEPSLAPGPAGSKSPAAAVRRGQSCPKLAAEHIVGTDDSLATRLGKAREQAARNDCHNAPDKIAGIGRHGGANVLREGGESMRKILCLILVSTGAVRAANLEEPPAMTQSQSQPDPSQSRSLNLAGAPNFRDIGGYATADGLHVRWDRIFRSSELSKLTPADAETVDALPSVWLHTPPDAYASPKTTLAPLLKTVMVEAQTPEGARAALMSYYARMPDEFRDEYAAMFLKIAAGKLPMLVHCTAGKDRTGVAMAVLLSSLGVPRQTVIEDYQLTEKLVPAAAAAAGRPAPVGGGAQPLASIAQLPAESRIALWRSDPAYIASALDSINREYGSFDAYLERGLGLSREQVQQVRRALLE